MNRKMLPAIKFASSAPSNGSSDNLSCVFLGNAHSVESAFWRVGACSILNRRREGAFSEESVASSGVPGGGSGGVGGEEGEEGDFHP